jgi:hypothetical protein
MNSPYIVGAYLMNGGDLPSHGGSVLDIILFNNIDFQINYYPFTHLLTFCILSICNLSYMSTIASLAPFFSILVPVFFYIAVNEATHNNKAAILSFLFSSTFYLSSLFQINSITSPNAVSILLLPIIFYLFLKRNNGDLKLSYSICLMVFLTAYIFYHPLSNFVLLFSVILCHFVCKFVGTKSDISSIQYFACAFFAYLFYLTNIWKIPVKNIKRYVLGYDPYTGASAVNITENIDKLGFDLYDIVWFSIKTFGHQIIMLLISSSYIYFLFHNRAKLDEKLRYNWFIFLLSYLFISGILFSVQMISPYSLNISFFRFLAYTLVFTPFFCSLFFSDLSFNFFNRSNGRFKNYSIYSVLSILFTISLFVIYPSPHINKINDQVTYSELEGSDWILNYKQEDIGISGYLGYSVTKRLISGLIPHREYVKTRYIMWEDQNVTVPDHFGYDQNDNSISDVYMSKRYILLTLKDIIAYTTVYSNVGRISLDDIKDLNYDVGASLTYNNGQYWVYYVS